MARKRRNVPRQPNGQPSRRKADVQAARIGREADILRGPIDARVRMTGLAEDVFRNWAIGKPNPGTHHGLLCLQRFITEKQWGAAEWYLKHYSAHLRAIGAPCEGWSDGDARGVPDTDRHALWVAETEARWQSIRAALQDCSTINRSPVIGAFEVVLERGVYLAHLMGDLRLGLNEIDLRFIVGNKKAA